MKKNLLVIFLFYSVLCIGQEHMKFKGIEMSLGRDSFVAKLESMGFKEIQNDGTSTLLQGTFANYKESFVFVLTNQLGKIYEIVVIFPPQQTWDGLYLSYTNLKKDLSIKYGECSSTSEKWDGMTPHSDYACMQMIYRGSCKYNTIWSLQQGEIKLLIGHSSDRCYVELHYVDQQNFFEYHQTGIDDL